MTVKQNIHVAVSCSMIFFLTVKWVANKIHDDIKVNVKEVPVNK